MMNRERCAARKQYKEEIEDLKFIKDSEIKFLRDQMTAQQERREKREREREQEELEAYRMAEKMRRVLHSNGSYSMMMNFNCNNNSSSFDF
jgi:hypothetical protein